MIIDHEAINVPSPKKLEVPQPSTITINARVPDTYLKNYNAIAEQFGENVILLAVPNQPATDAQSQEPPTNKGVNAVDPNLGDNFQVIQTPTSTPPVQSPPLGRPGFKGVITAEYTDMNYGGNNYGCNPIFAFIARHPGLVAFFGLDRPHMG